MDAIFPISELIDLSNAGHEDAERSEYLGNHVSLDTNEVIYETRMASRRGASAGKLPAGFGPRGIRLDCADRTAGSVHAARLPALAANTSRRGNLQIIWRNRADRYILSMDSPNTPARVAVRHAVPPGGSPGGQDPSWSRHRNSRKFNRPVDTIFAARHGRAIRTDRMRRLSAFAGAPATTGPDPVVISKKKRATS
jgi:hypothetical protein